MSKQWRELSWDDALEWWHGTIAVPWLDAPVPITIEVDGDAEPT